MYQHGCRSSIPLRNTAGTRQWSRWIHRSKLKVSGLKANRRKDSVQGKCKNCDPKHNAGYAFLIAARINGNDESSNDQLRAFVA